MNSRVTRVNLQEMSYEPFKPLKTNLNKAITNLDLEKVKKIISANSSRTIYSNKSFDNSITHSHNTYVFLKTILAGNLDITENDPDYIYTKKPKKYYTKENLKKAEKIYKFITENNPINN